MTPQPSEQPGTLRMVARIHPDIAAILKEPEVLTEFKRYAKHLWGSGVAIKAEAAAPDPVASPEGAADALAQAMADSGYADPDPTDQWVLPDAAIIVRRLRERGYTVDPVASPPDEFPLVALAACLVALADGHPIADRDLAELPEHWQRLVKSVASPAPLDVERLAAALDVLSADGDEYALMAPEDREFRYEAAQRLAAAYEAEGQPVADEPRS